MSEQSTSDAGGAATGHDRNLYQRMAAVMGELEATPRTGQNTQFNYSYIEQGTVMAILRPKFAAHGIVLIAALTAVDHLTRATAKGGEMFVARVCIDFTFVNADHPEDRLTIPWLAEGMDTTDKAINKAVVAGQKYVLMKTFLLSDADPDGEQAPTDQHASQARPQNRQVARPVRPTSAPATAPAATTAGASAPVKTERTQLLGRLQALRPGEMGIPWINRIADEIGGIQRIEVRDELTVGYLLTLVKRVEERDRRAKAPRAVTRHQTTVVDGPRPLDMPAGAPHDGRAVPEAPPVPPSERPPLARQFMDKLTEAAGIKDGARRGETLDLIQDQARIAYDNQALTHDEMSDINTHAADIRAQLPF